VKPQLRVAPAGERADVATGEGHLVGVDPLGFGDRLDEILQQAQKPPRLRRQLVERAAEDFVGDAIGGGDVVEGGLDRRPNRFASAAFDAGAARQSS